MNGRSRVRVSRPPPERQAPAMEFPHGLSTQRPSSCPAVRSGRGCATTSPVAAFRLCRVNAWNGLRVDAIPRLTFPQGAGREDTSAYQPTIDHASGVVQENSPDRAGYPNPALFQVMMTSIVPRSAQAGWSSRRALAARSVPQRVALQIRKALGSWGAYMPGHTPTGKGNIYNSPGIVGGGSQRGRVTGKMC